MAQKYIHDDVGSIDDACRLARQFDELAVVAKDFFKTYFAPGDTHSEYLTFGDEVEGSPHSFYILTPFGRVRADYSLNSAGARKYFGKLSFSRVPESEDAPRPAPFYGFVFDRSGYASLDLTPDQDWNLADTAAYVKSRVARAYALQLLGSLADTV